MDYSFRDKGIFITGSDTGVGKTHIGSQLAAFLDSLGYAVQPRKPAESGCEQVDGMLVPSDALAYHRAVKEKTALEEICPYRYEAPLAPPLAAEKEGDSLSLSQLVRASIVQDNTDFSIVEGAGGVYSPIANDGFNIDLCRKLALPALLVVENRLGCINQALLSYKALQAEGIRVAALVLNAQANLADVDYCGNLLALRDFLDIPVINSKPGTAAPKTLHQIAQQL